MSEVLVSVIIVSYNTEKLILECVRSIYKYTKDISYEIIVVDNDSDDNSVIEIRKYFPLVRVLELDRNYGFGTANNRGLAIAKGKYILYLNSDTVLLNNAIKYFYEYWNCHEAEQHLGAIGAVLVDTDGVITHSGGSFPSYQSICKWQLRRTVVHYAKGLCKLLHCEKFYKHIKKVFLIDYSNTMATTVDYITGADLFMKNDYLACFDENYFLYFEETDLQEKIARLGLNRTLIDGPKICHMYKKPDNDFTVYRKSDIYATQSAYYYSRKHFEKGTLLFSLIILDWLNPYSYSFNDIKKVKRAE